MTAPLKSKHYSRDFYLSQRLGVFNALLAHTPWKLRPEDVELLMRRDDSWSQVLTVPLMVVSSRFFVFCVAEDFCIAGGTLGCNCHSCHGAKLS